MLVLCTVLTLIRRMSSNNVDQGAADLRKATSLGIRQEIASSLPKHAVAVLLHQSRNTKVNTTERIQYTVVNVNTKVVRARSHFRARLWSPLVLFHHESSLRKERTSRRLAKDPYTMT
jgi:hypothetical protein